MFGQEHVDRYRETAGEEGHEWQGTTVLLLTTTGRKSGEKRTLSSTTPNALGGIAATAPLSAGRNCPVAVGDELVRATSRRR
jgi:hypothetical protein